MIPSNISTTGEDPTLWKANSDNGENAHGPSSIEYFDLPLLADNTDYVHKRQIYTVDLLSEKPSD